MWILECAVDRIFDHDRGTMLIYQGTNNGVIWDFVEFDYDIDEQDYTIPMDERRLTRSEIKRMAYGKEFLKQGI